MQPTRSLLRLRRQQLAAAEAELQDPYTIKLGRAAVLCVTQTVEARRAQVKALEKVVQS